ncbi:helix-turn-helix domain-containing protein [Gilvimarinus xylanilyticus]|uniref:AraC family transcriptional regulator n=1 Tax=Gilvimarinus xylanilyticus TaxID=2944139 RepID=A0A9X2HVT2_9GAMM|nr:AraC family transcriptional regulator [Gilvimarinus xylanilyticus]MCP8899095.1 AraC family transcriptional regulator [Gilvimarinus xylanilyticus]
MKTIEAWLAQLDPRHSAAQIFEFMPSVLYFVKDRDGHIMTGNQAFAERCGCASARELYGRRDDTLFPLYMVEKFRRDDATVFHTGAPLHDLIELFPTREGLPEWCVTHKVPLLNLHGEVVGLCGIVQSYERMSDHPERPEFQVVEYIRAHYAERLNIPDIAEQFGFSQRQLERRFADTFGASPREYIIRLRTLVACEHLRSSNTPVSDVALECGFYDHSSFIRHFKRILGVTPLAYRKHQNSQGGSH